MEQKRAEAAKYRENIYQERKDVRILKDNDEYFFFKSSFINLKYSACIFQKAVAASKEWKSKQVKRRKPEESDDAEVQAAYGAHLACQEFINFLPNFYG